MSNVLEAEGSSFDYSCVDASVAKLLRGAAKKIRGEIANQTRSIIETGQILLKVKPELKHGLFSRWILTEIGCSVRTAENYMRAANFMAELEGKSETISHLAPSMLYKLAAPSVPAETRTKILNALDGGNIDIGALSSELLSNRKVRAKNLTSLGKQSRAIAELASILRSELSQVSYHRVCSLMTSLDSRPSSIRTLLMRTFSSENPNNPTE